MAEVHDSALQLHGESALEELAAAVLEHSAGPVHLTAEQVGFLISVPCFPVVVLRLPSRKSFDSTAAYGKARTYNTGPWDLGIR